MEKKGEMMRSVAVREILAARRRLMRGRVSVEAKAVFG